jgi:hypothetical protein
MSDHLPVLLDVEVLGPQTLSLDDQKLANEIKFVNPNSGILNIQLGQAKALLQEVHLQNMSGQTVGIVQHKRDVGLKMDIHHLPNGVYFVNFLFNNGNQIVKKLIKI